MTIAKANTKVEDTPVRTIIIGDAYLEKGRQDTRRTFLLSWERKGKCPADILYGQVVVLLRFFVFLIPPDQVSRGGISYIDEYYAASAA